MEDQETESLKELQSVMTVCLDRIHQFCEENGIRYFLIGGTLIGAVRHGGPIPWDDDADIGMPRRDYEKFLSIADHLGAPYKVLHRGNDLTQLDNYAKCVNTETKVIERGTSVNKSGINRETAIWVDVFPIDGTYTNPFMRWLHIKSIGMLRAARRCKRGVLGRQAGWLGIVKQPAKVATYYAMHLVPMPVLETAIEQLLRLRSFENASVVANLLGAYGVREACSRNVLSYTTLAEYDGIKVCIPTDYDTYLTTVYGDYMKLPDEDRQYGQHGLEITTLQK